MSNQKERDVSANAKIAVPCNSDSLTSAVAERFARAPFIAVHDPDGGETTFLKTPPDNVGHGVGLRMAEMLIGLGVRRIVAVQVGPKAEVLLREAGVDIVVGVSGTVSDALGLATDAPA